MSRYIYQNVVQDGRGNLVSGASVTVSLAGGATAATIYTAVTGGTADADGIITTGSDGTFAFYVDEDDYPHSQRFRIVWSKSGFTSETWDYIQIFPDSDNTLITDSTVDQGDSSTVGTLAWHIANAASTPLIIKVLPGSYYLETGVTLPAGSSLLGDSPYTSIQREISDWETYSTVINIDPSVSITMSEGCTIAGINLLRYNTSLPMVYGDLGDWTGTAIILGSNAHFCNIRNVGIAGFANAIDNYKGSGDVTVSTNFYYAGNARIENVVFDTKTVGVRIGNSLSTLVIKDCESRCMASLGGDENDDDMERPGYAYHFAGDNDSVRVTNCLSYGWDVAFRVDSANDVTFDGCIVDHGTPANNSNRFGINIVSDDTVHTRVINCQIWGNITSGVRIANATSANQDTIISANSITVSNHGVQIIDGGAVITNNIIRGGEDGVYLDEDADEVIIDGNKITNMNYVIKTHASFTMANLIYGKNFTKEIATAFTDNWVSPSVASAGTVTLPSGHDDVIITGTTEITSITASFPGDIVTLRFTGADQLTDGSNLNLNGNFTSAAGDTLTLRCDGTNWNELARSDNTP